MGKGWMVQDVVGGSKLGCAVLPQGHDTGRVHDCSLAAVSVHITDY